MQSQCEGLAAARGSAYSATVTDVAASPGDTVDVGSPTITDSSQVGVGTPTLTNIVATGTIGLRNGGSQNVFTAGEATATFASYTFSGTIGTSTPYSFTFNCALSELVQVESTIPGVDVRETQGDCASRVDPKVVGPPGQFCAIETNRLLIPGQDQTIYTPTPTDRGEVAGNALGPQDESGSRVLTNVSSTTFASLAGTTFVQNNFAVANVLACNSPDSLGGLWVPKNSTPLTAETCATTAVGIGLSPISSPKRR
jgi:hypothetical protein